MGRDFDLEQLLKEDEPISLQIFVFLRKPNRLP